MKKNLFKCLSISLLSLFAISSCDDISDLLEEKPTADTQDKPAEENNSSTDKPKEEVKEETFKVVWHNGSVILETDEEVKKGSQPEYNGNKPTKSSDDDYDYSFLGWNTNPNATSPLSTLPNVEANLDFYAIFKANAIIKYSIKFFNQGKEITSAAKSVKAGKYNIKSDLYSLESPTKAEDSVGKYSFKGWSLSRPSNDLDGNIVTEIEVSADMELHASFILAKNSYKVIWMNETIQHDETIHVYGETPKPDASNPTKARTAQYTYTFLGWNSDSKATSPLDSLPIVSANATYYAIYKAEVNKYKVTFYNEGTELASYEKDYGTYNISNVYSNTPTKQSTDQYKYSFKGWTTSYPATETSPIVTSIDLFEDKKLYAVFSANIRSYNVIWRNYDGSEIASKSYEYNSTPTFTGNNPTRDQDNEYTYTFIGWNTDKDATTKLTSMPKVTKETTLYAIYSKTDRLYKITWKDYNGSTLKETEHKYNTTPSYGSSNPTRDSDNYYSYSFNGWNTNKDATNGMTLPNVTKNDTYFAIYSKTDKLYRITWKNYNGADLGYNDYKYNVTPNYSGSTPTRSSDSQYSYSFIGWNTDKNATTALSLPNVTKDETYYAIFKATPLASTVTFYYGKDHAKSFTQSVNYGSKPTYETVDSYDVQGYRYKFVGWSDTKGATTAQYKKEADFPTITSDRPFYAVYSSEVATYKIVWYLDEECSTSFTTPGTFSYDQSIPSSAYPTTTPKAKAKHSDSKFTYKFEGWYPGYEGMFNGQAWQLLGDDYILTQLSYIDLSTIKIRSDMYMYPVFKIVNAPGAIYGNNQFKSWSDLISGGYITVNSSTKALTGDKAKLNTLSNLTLFLDDSVKSIADNAFKDVTTLTRVYFGFSECTTIGSYAFSGCTGLTSNSIIHSDYLTTINAYAFNGTSNAFHELPSTITTVNQNAFAGITGVSNNNPLTIEVKGLTSQQITSKGIFKSGWYGSISNYRVKDNDGNIVYSK